MERGKLEDFYSKRFYWKEGEGGERKIKEIRMTAKARKKEWNWILAWSVEIRGSSWIASDHRSQRSCSELSNPGFLTHTCNIHRDIFAFRHRRRDAIRCLPRYYVAGIARFLVHFFFLLFFFYTFRNRSCRIEFQRWNIFIPRRESRNLILNREQAAWKKT